MDLRGVVKFAWFWLVAAVGVCIWLGVIYFLAIVNEDLFGIVMIALMIAAGVIAGLWDIWRRRSRSAGR